MSVTLTDAEFKRLYKTFEALMDSQNDDEKILAAMSHEDALWKMLQRLKKKYAPDLEL